MNIGKAIYQLRKERGLTQEQIQWSAKMGKNQLTLIERNHIIPTIDTLQRICKVLEIKLSDLIIKAESL